MNFSKQLRNNKMFVNINLPRLFLRESKTVKHSPLRYFSKVTEDRQFSEVRIPVQWGHIAGKWWGPKNLRPILAVHGWQDNSGSFDTLIPYLPPSTPILAIDIPGHGLSSPLPPGIAYFGEDIIRWMYELVNFFEWPKVSILSHSMGAIAASFFSSLFPDRVDFLICIDNFKGVLSRENENEVILRAQLIKLFSKYNQQISANSPPPVYSWEEWEKKLVEGSKESVSLESTKYILKRNLKRSPNDPNKFYNTIDPRVKAFYVPAVTQQLSLMYVKNIKCPFLFIKADRSPYLFDKKENVLEAIEVLKKSSKDCRMVIVPGSHHVHLNNPENVERHINDFLKTHDVSDRKKMVVKHEIFVAN